MKINDPNNGLISGKIGNMIYYVINGKQYIRRAAIPGKKRKAEISGLHPKHQKMITRFSMVQSYYSFFRKNVSDMIWKYAAQAQHCRATNLFNRMNSACFSGDGKLVDFATFHFSYGELQLPRNMNLQRDGDIFRLTWEDERTDIFTDPEDQLYVGIIYDAHPGSPCLLNQVYGKRGDMQGSFQPEFPPEGAIHAYCFFGSKDETAYSASLYFKLS